MKITNIEDINRIEQELLEVIQDNTDYSESTGCIVVDGQFVRNLVDQRWLAIAKTDLEKGFMALRRAIGDKE